MTDGLEQRGASHFCLSSSLSLSLSLLHSLHLTLLPSILLCPWLLFSRSFFWFHHVAHLSVLKSSNESVNHWLVGTALVCTDRFSMHMSSGGSERNRRGKRMCLTNRVFLRHYCKGVCLCVSMCVCVCVCERESDREPVCICKSTHALLTRQWICVSTHTEHEPDIPKRMDGRDVYGAGEQC